MTLRNRLYSICMSVAVAAIFGSATLAGDGDRYLAKAAFDHERYDIALSEYTKLATSGDTAALFALGHMFLNGLGVAPDPTRGMELMRQAAEGGHYEAASVICFDLFERAKTRADLEEVVHECTPAGIYTGGSKPTELSFDKNYVRCWLTNANQSPQGQDGCPLCGAEVLSDGFELVSARTVTLSLMPRRDRATRQEQRRGWP